jgi:hypothetical protein
MAQLQEAWREIRHWTDLTLEELAKVEWSQVLINAGKGLLILVVAIAGALVVFALAVVLVAALVFLIELAAAALAAGGAAWAAFAALFGAVGLAAAN